MRRHRSWLGLGGYLIAVTGLLYLATSHRAYDDPFITYRYAENLRTGLGFVYNPGERVLSTTTPLFTLLLAGLGHVWPDLPKLAHLIGAFSLAAGGLVFWDLGRSWGTRWAGWSGLLLYPTFPLVISTLGSETPLFLTLVLGAFALFARGRYGEAAVVSALATLARSDGALVAALLGGWYVWERRARLGEADFWREQPWGWFALAGGMLLAWHGFAWAYFGDPLPATLAAKQAQGRMAISRLFAPNFLRVAGWYSQQWQNWVELGLFVPGMMLAFFRERRWLLILGWTGLYFVAYTLLGVSGYFWYYAPLGMGWVVAVGLGIAFGERLPGLGRVSLSGSRIRLGLGAVLLAALCLGQGFQVHRLSGIADPRYGIYRAVGNWLAENTPPDARVGALEVGIVGYYSRRPMVDFAGLIQPEVAELMAAETTYDDTALWAAWTYRPDYLVLVDGVLPRLEQEFGAVFCRPVQGFAGAEYGFSGDMQVYACEYD